jgi:hypothetical protein
MTTATGVTTGVGASAINDSIDGKTPTIESSVKAAAYSLAGPGKAAGQTVGKVMTAVQSMAGKSGDAVIDVTKSVVEESVSSTVDKALDLKKK